MSSNQNYQDIPNYGDGHWKGPVPNAGSLPATGNSVGDARIDTSTDTIYVWTGSSWVAVATPGAAIAIDGLNGDATASGPGVVPITLATVNSSPGTYTYATVTVNGKGLVTSATNGAAPSGGTVTSVGLSLPSIFTITGSPVTTSGTLTGTFNTQTANTIFSGPSSGGAATPTFRALVTADLPAGTGTVTSVALTVPSDLSVSGSPITTSGTLAVTRLTQLQNLFLASADGSIGVPTYRSIVNGDLTGITTLPSLSLPATQLTGTLQAAQFPTLTGDVTTIAGSLATTLANVNGNVGSFTYASITVNAKGLITAASSGAAPSGTVTSVSVVTANGLAGTVATATTTPAITLSTTITGILQGNGTAISAATTGNLTDVGTDGITVTGGTGAVLGSGTSLSQHVADTTHNGYLSSTDWNTFNGKQSTVTIGALDAQAANANGLALVSNVLSTQSADATHPGMVNNTTQTLSGSKTFTGTLTTDNAISIVGTGGSGVLTVATQSAEPTTPAASSVNFYSDASGRPSFMTSDGFIKAIGGTLTDDRVYTFQDVSGTVSLNPTVSTITSNTTAVDNTIYLIDTSGGVFNLTLPTPSSGVMIRLKDTKGTCQANPLTIVRNASESIEGQAASYTFQSNWGSLMLIADGTNWFFI